MSLRRVWPVLLLAAVMSLAHVIATPAFWPVDELSHIAYADQVVTSGTLPHIDTRIPADLPYLGFSERLQWEVDERHDGRQDIWTSNHPPLSYAVQGVALAIGSWAAGGTAGIVLARLTSVAWLVAGVWAAMQLAFLMAPRRPAPTRRLTPSSVAYAVGTIVAITPTLSHLGGLVFNDVPAFALSTLCLLLGTRAALTGLTPNRMAWLGLLGGLAALTRISCLPAVGLAFLLAAYAWWRQPPRSPSAGAYRGALLLSVVALAPAAVFFVRNVELYGSVTATGWLFEKFGRDLNDPLGVLLSDQTFWARLWNRMMADLTTGHWAFGIRATMTQAVLLMVLTAVGWWLIQSLHRPAAPSQGDDGVRPTLVGAIRTHPRRVAGTALAMLPVALLVTTIGFHSAGGSLHGRYMLGGHAVLVLGIVVVLDQLPRLGRVMIVITTLLLFVVDAALLRSLVNNPVKPWAAAGAELNLPLLFGAATQTLTLLCTAAGVGLLVLILRYQRRDRALAPAGDLTPDQGSRHRQLPTPPHANATTGAPPG